MLLRDTGPRHTTVFFRRDLIRLASLLLLAATASAQTPPQEIRYHSLVPLGAEAFDLQGEGWKAMITLLASAENPQFEGMVRRQVERHDVLFSPDGSRIQHYPDHIAFRVTASFRTRLMEPSPFPVGANGDANDYLLHLQFRLVIFDGLRQTVVQPESVEMIGMPGDIPYDERIYRIVVNLPQTPVRDRMVLEVRDSVGDRICKFHLDLL